METNDAMTPLSPAAQAVLATYEKVWSQGYGSPLAAALRAAISEIEKGRYNPSDRFAPDRWFDGHAAALTGAVATLRNIADELENNV